jgi:hypothetical protein
MREGFGGHNRARFKAGRAALPAIFRLTASILPNALSWAANAQRIAGKPLDERDFVQTAAKN